VKDDPLSQSSAQTVSLWYIADKVYYTTVYVSTIMYASMSDRTYSFQYDIL